MGVENTMKVYNKELSIQVTLSGFSFSIASPLMHKEGRVESYDFDSCLAGCYDSSAVVEWSSPSALIIPFEVFDHRSIDNYLRCAAMLNPMCERSLFAVRGEYVVVWSVESELYEYITQRLPHAEHKHSLLRLADYSVSVPSVIIEVDSASVLHIVVKGSYGLEAAHSVKINGVQDIVFYIKTLCDDRGIAEQVVYISGDMEPLAVDFISSYFRVQLF